MPELVHSHLNLPDEPDEDDGRDSPADDAVPRQVVPNEPERAADASEGPPPAPEATRGPDGHCLRRTPSAATRAHGK